MLRTIPVLRLALAADAVASGAMGLLLALGSGQLAPWLGLPEGLLLRAGIALLPFAAFVAWTAARQPTPSGAAWLVVAVNAAWVIGSAALVMLPPTPMTGLGYAFVAVQALAVLALAVLQWIGLGRMASTRSLPA